MIVGSAETQNMKNCLFVNNLSRVVFRRENKKVLTIFFFDTIWVRAADGFKKPPTVSQKRPVQRVN